MARSRSVKYVRYADGQEYLYDLAGDPGETRNVIGDSAYSGARQEAAAAWRRGLTHGLPAMNDGLPSEMECDPC